MVALALCREHILTDMCSRGLRLCQPRRPRLLPRPRLPPPPPLRPLLRRLLPPPLLRQVSPHRASSCGMMVLPGEMR
jgi:hypothetical protein